MYCLRSRRNNNPLRDEGIFSCSALVHTSTQVSDFGLEVENIFVDKGYKGHEIKDKTVHICSHAKKKKAQSLWKKVKKRAGIEPVIKYLNKLIESKFTDTVLTKLPDLFKDRKKS